MSRTVRTNANSGITTISIRPGNHQPIIVTDRNVATSIWTTTALTHEPPVAQRAPRERKRRQDQQEHRRPAPDAEPPVDEQPPEPVDAVLEAEVRRRARLRADAPS